MKSMQDDLKTIKRNMKQSSDTNREFSVLPAGPNLEERLVVIEPGEKTYPEVSSTLKDCRLTEDKL